MVVLFVVKCYNYALFYSECPNRHPYFVGEVSDLT